MGDVWIDLTDLYAWKGHFSGIQRVVYTYAMHYERKGARFFVYLPQRRIFLEVKDILPAQSGLTTPRRQKVKRMYKSVTPLMVRKITTPMMRRTQHLLTRAVFKLKRGLSKTHTVHSPFMKNDKVLIMGAGWESFDFINSIINQKGKIGFEVHHLIHDVLPLSQPHLFDKKLVARFNTYMSKALPICDGIISVSKATLSDAVDFCNSKNLPLTGKRLIIRLGEDTFTATKVEKPNLDVEKGNFVFSLGTLEVRKNHQLLYATYKLADTEGVKLPKLVIVGRPGWLAHDFYDVLKADKKMQNTIQVISGVSDSQIGWLYENCLFTVYPSICEGWGLPISDSIGKGKLCLTCNVSSMPEVAGSLADYFNPYDARDCLNKILKYSTDAEALEKKEQAIKAYKKMTWTESFEKLELFLGV